MSVFSFKKGDDIGFCALFPQQIYGPRAAVILRDRFSLADCDVAMTSAALRCRQIASLRFALSLRDPRLWVNPDSLPGVTSVWRKCIKDPHYSVSSY